MITATIPTQFDFFLKTDAKFGAGRAKQLGQYLHNLKKSRIGIIIDPGVARLDYTNEIINNLKKDTEIQIIIWEYNLKGEPDYDSLDRIKLLFMDKDSKPLVDCFVGIGGGSVIDFAKGLSTLLVNPGKALKLKGFPENITPSLPTIAIPTTAGTGSEVTYNASFIDNETKVKLGINTRNNLPIIAIIDPLFMLNAPPSVTASSGMDALVHSLESYAASQSNPITKIFAKEAFHLLFNNLNRIEENPKEIEIRQKLQMGAYLAGITLINSGAGPTAALSYPLGVHFKVPHGIAGAVFLPHVIQHNTINGYDYSELYDLIDNVDLSLSRCEKNQLFSEKMFSLCKKMQIPEKISSFGVTSENIQILLSEAHNYEKNYSNNPVSFSVEDAKELLKRIL